MMKNTMAWVELPASKFGIEYSMETTLRSRFPLRPKNSFKIRSRIKKKPPRKSPFETMLDTLNHVTCRFQYPEGTAIMYVREIFEPGDPEFDYIGAKANAIQLSEEQVDRIRLMIIPGRREELLVAYLNYYDMASKDDHIFNESANVIRHFDGFKRRYSNARCIQEKFDLLFGFSFAIKQYSGWMYRREERIRAREKMVVALARHWRNLLRKNSPEELGLDTEFSYPALLTFLRSFKRQTESVETFGDPPMKFVFEAEEMCVSSDEKSVSTMTMSISSMFSL